MKKLVTLVLALALVLCATAAMADPITLTYAEVNPLDTIVGMGTQVNSAINSVSTLVLFAVVPFNLLKGIIVSALTFLLYKRISPILHKNDEKMLKRREKRTSDADSSAKS